MIKKIISRGSVLAAFGLLSTFFFGAVVDAQTLNTCFAGRALSYNQCLVVNCPESDECAEIPPASQSCAQVDADVCEDIETECCTACETLLADLTLCVVETCDMDCEIAEPTPEITSVPTKSPTKAPTKAPTRTPTRAPTRRPTRRPTPRPTRRPSE